MGAAVEVATKDRGGDPMIYSGRIPVLKCCPDRKDREQAIGYNGFQGVALLRVG